MKVALIYPPISVKERYGLDIGDIGGRQAPLGIMYLSAFIKRVGYETLLIDACAEDISIDEIVQRIESFGSRIVGISSTSIALRNSHELAKKLKIECGQLITILGGAHISSSPNDLQKLEFFDFGIQGEGELVFINLISAIEKNQKDFSDIDGLVWRKNGDVIINKRAGYIEPLDILPRPDRNGLKDIRLYRPPIMCYREEPVISVITSRGCPYQCTFCDKSVFGSKIRFFSDDYVIEELKELKSNFGAKEFSFVDDTFPCNKDRFEKLLKRMRDEIKTPFTCMANANDLDENIIKLMKEAGCWQIAIGIESGDDEILKIIKKKSSCAKVAKIADAAHKSGIYVKGFFMIGNPGESIESIEKTKKFALSLPLTDVTCTIATPINGSEFYDMAKSGLYGEFVEEEQSKFNYWKPVFIPRGLNETILLIEQKKFFLSFYLRWSIIIRQIKKIRSLKILFRLFRTLTKLIYSIFHKNLFRSVRKQKRNHQCKIH